MNFIKQGWDFLNFINNDEFSFLEHFAFFSQQSRPEPEARIFVTQKQIVVMRIREKLLEQCTFPSLASSPKKDAFRTSFVKREDSTEHGENRK